MYTYKKPVKAKSLMSYPEGCKRILQPDCSGEESLYIRKCILDKKPIKTINVRKIREYIRYHKTTDALPPQYIQELIK